MPLTSWNDIRDRSLAFSKEWSGEESEHAEAKSFWDAFFTVFGVTRRRIATFEEHVKKYGGRDGFIDLFWRGTLLVEHKSKGKDLDKAYGQAVEYFEGIDEKDLPRYILVSDFARFRLYDLDESTQHEFPIEDLHKNIKLFGFIAGYKSHDIQEQDPVNIKAAELMGALHDQMQQVGYTGHDLEVYLVRLLFCLFAEDTGIFEPQQFQDYVEQRTHEDGSDLAHHLATLFHVLNTAEDKRLTALDEQLSEFPFVNGDLYSEVLPPAAFNREMRQALLDCCILDWSRISPAIFGALFQSIMDSSARRNLGAHYTSEANILKVINPLFMDELREEFARLKGLKRGRSNQLMAFHQKLRSMVFLDPACGCGNFLVIAYRELRLLELEVLRLAYQGGQLAIDAHQIVQLDVDQFFGIEIEEFPAQIAQVALWLMDHQMNLKVSEEFGLYFARIPLKTSAHITHGNALQVDWTKVISPSDLSYIIGNPPFVGAKFMDSQQRKDVAAVMGHIPSYGLLDFVSAWYVKAVEYIKLNPKVTVAYVSTNSITLGEQVGVLWGWLLSQNVVINFAHRTFSWSNEARGKAAVHCVIIGFGLIEASAKRLFEYENIKGQPHEAAVSNINPYLLDANDTLLTRRSNPVCNVPSIGIGNKPIDNGRYLFTPEEKAEFLKVEPQAKPWFRRWMGAKEFINGIERWCLWLGECPPNELKKMPEALKRVEEVRQYRLDSKSKPTNRLAATPTRFHVENIPDSTFLVIPEVSSERRTYIPIGFMGTDVLASNKLRVMSDATLYEFGILSSGMHMAWVRYTTGRLKSDFQYSVNLVYNNYPWPNSPTASAIDRVKAAAQEVIDTRSKYPDSTLADLYDPLTMPQELFKAHAALDSAVERAYSRKRFLTDSERVAFLFELYQKYTSLVPATKKSKAKSK